MLQWISKEKDDRHGMIEISGVVNPMERRVITGQGPSIRSRVRRERLSVRQCFVSTAVSTR